MSLVSKPAGASGRDGVIAMCVALLAEAFGKTISTVTIDAYRLGLEGLAPEAIKRSVETALRQSKFMPTPAELRQLAGGLSLADRAQQAWLVAEQAVADHSSYRTVEFDDPAINATVRSLGGWVAFCTTEAKEFDTFVRQRFLATYEALARSGVPRAMSGPLQGAFDAHNGLHGFREQEIRRIETGLPPLPAVTGLEGPPPPAPLALPEFKKP